MGKVGGGAVEGVEGMERTGLMRERWEEKRPGCGCELDGGGGCLLYTSDAADEVY